MPPKSDKEKIRKIEENANDRPKPSGLQHIVLTPSTLKTRGTPEWMRSAQANAMIEEAERYQESARKDKDRELCIGIVHTKGKPCPNNSLKSSLYCRSCKKALHAGS